jgi:hypothetical protein
MLGPVEAAGEHEVELVEGGFPVEAGAAALAGSGGATHLAAGEVEHLDQRVVGGEVPARLADLT